MTAEAPSAGWFEGPEHVLPVRIYYEDTDFTGMVYHANFLRYFERGRSDYMRVVGVDHTSLLNRPDPLAELNKLFEARRALYQAADHEFGTELYNAQQITDQIATKLSGG